MRWQELMFSLFFAAVAAFAAESLLPNGGFEQADAKDPSHPAGWDKVDGLGVVWTNAPKGSDGIERGKAIRIDTTHSEIAMCEQWKKTGLEKYVFPKPQKNPIAETYGLSYYSDPIPVEKGQPYKVTFDYKSKFQGMLWVRGYGMLNNEKRRLWETKIECRASADDWVTISQEFWPTKYRPAVTEMRVMLYAYYPPGIYWYDNVKIEPITEAEYNQMRAQGANVASPRKPSGRPAPTPRD